MQAGGFRPRLIALTQRVSGAGDEALGFQTAQPLNPQPPLPEDGARGSKSGDSLATPSATNHSPLVTVSVKDSGVGIPAEMLPKIFELFTQVDQSLEKSQGGLGIGLSLVIRLVEMHGGRVEARSEGRGKGSEFVVRLPVDMSNVETASQTNDVPAPIPSSKRRILVADDNKDAASTLAMMLKFLGNEVRTAHDGLQAVEVAEEFRPDVVLLDIGMPKLNGYEACRRMREQAWCKETFLIALTGWGQDEDKRRSQEAGFHQHWVKPVEPVALKKLLAGLETVGDVSP